MRTAVRGRVITPADADYDALRTIMLGGVDRIRRPSCESPTPTMWRRWSGSPRRGGLDLAVRSGGHSGAGHSSIDGGIVVDVRDLDTLEIDVAGRTAWAGSGLTAAEFTQAAAATRPRDRVR